MQIQFIGGVGTVTGSKTILKYKGYSLLIDCGLFQGLKENRLKNWQPFIHDPEKIDAIILTHAHLDHCGYIPRFLAEGYKGEIYCSKATFSLCKIILPDSGYLQEEEARFRNKTKSTKHHPALPLYTEEQAKLSLDSFVTIALHQPFKLGPFSVEYLDAGHILGACSVKITSPEGKSILFSGDLGRYNDLLMTSPENRSPSNYVVMETTYGNRLHSKEDPLKVLKNIL
ncbi:MAG: MBL fold metallo-hydrolase, partial [Bdellovibrionales bacterium]|nr:MBL fold metallo-hydrolase [Bdellovibrionales bacterium]